MQMSQEWKDRWEVIAANLMAEAVTRGGSVSTSAGQVRLHAPRDSEGTCLRIVTTEPEVAYILGEGLRATSTWALQDDDLQHMVVKMVIAIMDGHALISDNGLYRIADLGSTYVDDAAEPIWSRLCPWQTQQQ